MKNHYRGHKLSLWLNLIPQLHMPGDLSELSMRHHHFAESDAKYYDGIVREQTYDKPIIVRTTKIDVKLVPTKPSTVKVPLTTGKFAIALFYWKKNLNFFDGKLDFSERKLSLKILFFFHYYFFFPYGRMSVECYRSTNIGISQTSPQHIAHRSKTIRQK